MIKSLALIILVGFALASICDRLKLPRLIGMLITGLVLGPFVLDLLDPKILSISQELRKIALIIILLKAGFSLDLKDLKKVGLPAMLLSFLPASFEILAYYLFAPKILGISGLDALVMGAVLAAVSPAVVVPSMVKLIEEKRGTEKSIPQMILAGASMDDIFVIVLFTSFLAMAQGKAISLISFANIPLSIVLGIIIGVIFGYFLNKFFEYSFKKGKLIRNSMKIILIMGFAFLLITFEEILSNKIAMSALIAIISMAAILRSKSNQFVSMRLSEKFGKLWLVAEIILFVLVGAAVDIGYSLKAGMPIIFMIIIALVFRSIAVVLSVSSSNLNAKEIIFCVLAYLPKATVQAAIGPIPLAAGLASGNIILSIAVTAILITAPIGAIGIDWTYKRLLSHDV